MKLMTESAVKLNTNSHWLRQAELQKLIRKSLYNPKFLIFGDEGTGKTHNGCSAEKQRRFEGKYIYVNSFSPLFVIDCNRSAKLIAAKDFSKEYAEGKIIVINPYVEEKEIDGKIVKVPIKDPIKRVVAVRNLITECKNITKGALFIDGLDQVATDCMYYIYRQYNMHVKDDGSIYKTEYDSHGNRSEKRVGGIVQFQYGARNKPLYEIVNDLSMLTIPVIITAHTKEKYENNKATGIIQANLINAFNDDVDCIIHLKNYEKMNKKKVGGAATVEFVSMRKMIIKKNRFQKGKAPDNRVIEKESFEFTEMFKILTEGI